ncbi:hypothetical protein O181_012557 [Austropuccinia psidii MF-1]|uniref:Uncharacterized protein n=1 Tax=Austropuccinia psidii MF-1 TaxID=1389203 RepID=A0A9Q3GN48_9BASI|nr:hypothetical protein [Austropuccinia psidii MF-1]
MAQGQVSLSNINDTIKQSFHIPIHSIPPIEYQNFILKEYSSGSSKKNLSSVNASSIHLRNHMHSIQSGLIKTCISIIHHGKIIKPSSLPNLASYKFHQKINPASSIQYRSASSLKESGSQHFTYTSLL